MCYTKQKETIFFFILLPPKVIQIFNEKTQNLFVFREYRFYKNCSIFLIFFLLIHSSLNFIRKKGF